MRSEVSSPGNENRVDGERVYVMLLRPSDFDDRLLSLFRQAYSERFYSGSGRQFDEDILLQDVASGIKNDELFFYGIFDISNDLVIGAIKIGLIDKKHLTSDMVIMIGDPDYRGKGLATDAIRLGNQAAFRLHGIRKLHGGMHAENVASIKAYTRADWIVEGTLKDHFLVDGQPMDFVRVACFNPDWKPGK